MKKDKTTNKTTNKTTKRKEVEYCVNLNYVLIDEESKDVKITFKKEGLLGKLGFTYTRDYVLADMLRAILTHIPANNISKDTEGVDVEVMKELYSLYVGSLYDSKETICVSKKTINYLYPTIGGFSGMSLYTKYDVLENAITEIG